MSRTAPHYLLLSHAQTKPTGGAGAWGFVLERMDGSGRIEVTDFEPDVRGERLQLLAIVRGLEALEQPSHVTLITPSRFIGRGMRRGLSVWRDRDWQWERYGVMTEIKNADLWQRIDRAQQFHRVQCRVWNFTQLFQSTTSFEETSNSRLRNRREGAVTSFKIPNWSTIASAVTDGIFSTSQPQQAYSCA